MFIALEGIDGSGKTSVAESLMNILEEGGRPVVFARHNDPNLHDAEVATYLKALIKLKDDTHSFAYARLGDPHWALIRASYYSLIDRCLITPALEARKTVIADGWFYKFIARLVASRTRHPGDFTSPEQVLPIFSCVRTPDRVVVIDTPVKLCAQRKQAINVAEFGAENYGKECDTENFINYQSEVRGHLLSIPGCENWETVDGGADPPQRIAEKIAATLELIARYPVGVAPPISIHAQSVRGEV